MPVRVSCPECSQQYQLKDELAGKKVRCKTCEAVIPVPPAKAVAAKPKVQYDEVEFEDDVADRQDDEFDFDDFEREERRSRKVKQAARPKPKKKATKKRRISALASIEQSKAATYASVGGGIVLVNSLLFSEVPMERLFLGLLIMVCAFAIGCLIGAIILRAALKLVTSMDLPFGEAYLMAVANGLGGMGAGHVIGVVLVQIGFNPRDSILFTVALLLVLSAGIPSFILGSCILDEYQYPIGMLKGFLVYLAEILVIIVLMVLLSVVFGSLAFMLDMAR